MQLRAFVVALAWFSAYGLQARAGDHGALNNGSLGVQAAITHVERLAVFFSISNRSDKVVVIDKSQVSWASYYHLELKAYRFDGLRGSLHPLSRSRPIADPPVGSLRLLPQECASGSISLRRAFPKIEEALSTSDVLIFWRFAIGKEEARDCFQGTLLIHSSNDSD